MPDKITDFHNYHGDALSNFHRCEIYDDSTGITYHSVEAAYQAAKSLDIVTRQEISKMSARSAKKKGRVIEVREDWKKVNIGIMFDFVLHKFSNSSYLKNILLETGDAILVEENYWHDNFFGECVCDKCTYKEKYNVLGTILMVVRDRLKKEVT